jgi:hypothetical protein
LAPGRNCNGEPGQTLKQVAADFGIAVSCLRNWLKAADVEWRCGSRTPAGMRIVLVEVPADHPLRRDRR